MEITFADIFLNFDLFEVFYTIMILLISLFICISFSVSAADCRLVDRIAVVAGVRNRLRDLVLPSCTYSTATTSSSASSSTSSASAETVGTTSRGNGKDKDRGSVEVSVFSRDGEDCNDLNVSYSNGAGNTVHKNDINNRKHLVDNKTFLRATITLDDLVLRMSNLYGNPKGIKTENRNNSFMKNSFHNITDLDHENQEGRIQAKTTKGFNQHNYRSKIEEKNKIVNRKSDVKNADGTYDISVLEASYEHIESSSGSISVSVKLRNISM